MSTELYIIRHGLAGEHGSYANDNERPLTEEGHQKTRQIAKQLVYFGLQVDLILTSPLVRAKQTADILLSQGFSKQLEESVYLSPAGDFNAWLGWLGAWRRSVKSNEVALAIVGHEPDLSEWAERLVWGEPRQGLILKKAGVIGLTLPLSGLAVGRSKLFWLAPPRLLLK